MKDLRQKVLTESKKTVSRKAKLRGAEGSLRTASATQSPRSTPAQSRRTSPLASPYYSEAEDYNGSDFYHGKPFGEVGSGSVSGDEDGEIWSERLGDAIDELVNNRKHSNGQSRLDALRIYSHVLRHHYAMDIISRPAEGKSSTAVVDLMPVLFKSIEDGATPGECEAALQALIVTLLTKPGGGSLSVLKSVSWDSTQTSVKVAAIHAMITVVGFGDADEEDAQSLLEFLMSIIESDGVSINAEDDGKVVTAALQAWAFLASEMEGDILAEQSNEAMDAFIEQLDSTDVDVQSNAGFNIALMFEANRNYEAETGENFGLRYDRDTLIARMKEFSKESVRSRSKRDRKNLNINFKSIVTSLEEGKGPNYSTAIRGSNPHEGGDLSDTPDVEFGYRNKVRAGNITFFIDSWALNSKVRMLKTLLGGGFNIHLQKNPTITECLGSVVSED